MISQNEQSVNPVITHENIENFQSNLHINKLFEKITNNFKMKNMNPLEVELAKNVKEEDFFTKTESQKKNGDSGSKKERGGILPPIIKAKKEDIKKMIIENDEDIPI